MPVVIVRQRKRISCRHAARNDGYLMNGIAIRQHFCKYSVADLVVSCAPLVFFSDHSALLLRARYDALNRLFHFVHADVFSAPARSKYRGLVQDIFKVSTNKSWRHLCKRCKVNLFRKGLILRMDAQDSLPALDVGIAYDDLSVKSSRPQQCGV